MPPYSWLEDPNHPIYLREYRVFNVDDDCCWTSSITIEEEKKPMMKPKYKIGDKVRINEKATKVKTHNDVYLEWTYSKARLIGKVLTISGIDPKDNTYHIAEGAYYEWFHEAWLTPADDKVVIMVDKNQPNKVIARNTSTGKTAEAKCAPGDDFDFYKGAALALQRLSENEKPEEEKHYNGKVVCVESTDALFTVGKVYTVKDGDLIDNAHGRYQSLCIKFSNVEQINERYAKNYPPLQHLKFIEYKGEAGK